MEINESIYTFKLLNKFYSCDVESLVYEFKDSLSGATIIYLENEDTNKCFGVGFKTLPHDSTGVCHIIEHSVLCGSKKYPLKEPFVNLLKGSMSTFLNAITSSDWTMYPIASQNDKDFKNLMSCYLDACFAPLSMTDKKPFLQEGWHYELNNIDDTPVIKGVVYNEMKGAMSSVYERLNQETLNSIYKGSPYGLNSGGEPKDIPNLTYEEYKKFYSEHYQPGNALFYLYGKQDIKESLGMIYEYTKNFKYFSGEVIEIPQKRIDLNVIKPYEISKTEPLRKNSYISYAFALSDARDLRTLKAISILDEVLMGSNDAPLKKKLLALGKCENVDSSIYTSSILPIYSFVFSKTSKSYKNLFINKINEYIKEIISNGIDSKALIAIINKSEFQDLEKDMGSFPKGLSYLFPLMSAYNYQIPYDKVLSIKEDYNYFKAHLNDGYFESILEKYFLNSSHKTCVTLVPSRTLQEENEHELLDKMTHLKETLSLSEKEALLNETKELISYQSHHDTKEELETLPTLELSDINLNVNELPYEKTKDEDFTLLTHEIKNDSLVYAKIYFDLSHLSLDELEIAKTISDISLELDTLNFDAIDFQRHLMTYLGDLSTSLKIHLNKEVITPRFEIEFKALKENIGYIKEALNELIFNLKFDGTKIKTLLLQIKSNLRSQIIENGMKLATLDVESNFNLRSYLISKLTGYSRYNFIDTLINKDIDKVIKSMKEVYSKLFLKKGLVISLAGSKNNMDNLYQLLKSVKYNEQEYQKGNIEIQKFNRRAIVIPSEVNYNALGISLNKDVEISGKLNVLTHILRYDYLWSEVRVKGGAYGTSISAGLNSKLLSVASYRDPNVKNTYEVFKKIYDYLDQLSIDSFEFKNYLIGAIGSYDAPSSINSLHGSEDNYYFNGIKKEDRMKIKDDMIHTTLNDIKNYKILFKDLSDAKIETIGNSNEIKKVDFDEIKTL